MCSDVARPFSFWVPPTCQKEKEGNITWGVPPGLVRAHEPSHDKNLMPTSQTLTRVRFCPWNFWHCDRRWQWLLPHGAHPTDVTLGRLFDGWDRSKQNATLFIYFVSLVFTPCPRVVYLSQFFFFNFLFIFLRLCLKSADHVERKYKATRFCTTTTWPRKKWEFVEMPNILQN